MTATPIPPKSLARMRDIAAAIQRAQAALQQEIDACSAALDMAGVFDLAEGVIKPPEAETAKP